MATPCGNCKCLSCVRNVDIGYNLTDAERADLEYVCLNCDDCRWNSHGPYKTSNCCDDCEHYVESEINYNLRANQKRKKIVLSEKKKGIVKMNEEKLQNYLRKCELQYRADHTKIADELEWLAPYCDTVQDIATYLREIGFRIKTTVDRTYSDGEKHQWVETTSGIVVYVNAGGLRGLFAKAFKKGR